MFERDDDDATLNMNAHKYICTYMLCSLGNFIFQLPSFLHSFSFPFPSSLPHSVALWVYVWKGNKVHVYALLKYYYSAFQFAQVNVPTWVSSFVRNSWDAAVGRPHTPIIPPPAPPTPSATYKRPIDRLLTRRRLIPNVEHMVCNVASTCGRGWWTTTIDMRTGSFASHRRINPKSPTAAHSYPYLMLSVSSLVWHSVESSWIWVSSALCLVGGTGENIILPYSKVNNSKLCNSS